MDVHASAWFLKKPSGFGKSQRRFFMIEGSSISYFAKNDGLRGVDRKGTITITPNTTVNCRNRDFDIAVEGRTYHLQADTSTTAKQWHDLIMNVVRLLSGDSSGKIVNRSRTVTESRIVKSSSSGAIRSGWFVKKAEKVGKNQRRWFELFSSELKYFSREVHGKGRDEKGVIPLSAAQVSHNDPELTIYTPNRIYYLISDVPGDVQYWAEDISKHTPALLRRSYTAAPVTETTEQSSAISNDLPAGPSNTARRFSNYALISPPNHSSDTQVAVAPEIVASSNDPSSGNDVPATDTTPIQAWEENQSTEIGNSGMYTNPAFSDQLSTHESTQINGDCAQIDTINGNDILLTEGKSTAVTTVSETENLNTGVFEEVIDSTQVAHPMADDMSEATDFGFAGARERLPSISLGVNLHDESYSDGALVTPSFSGSTAVCCGWLLKHADGLGKSRKRYFLLQGTTMSYYENEVHECVETGFKGAIQLDAACTVDGRGKDFQIIQKSRTWRFTADDPEQASSWKTHLLGVIEGIQEQKAILVDKLELSGWFRKKAEKAGRDQERFFVLRPDRIDYFVKEENGRGKNLKGSINLNSLVDVDIKGSELILSTPDRVWSLSASPEQCMQWRDVLVRSVPNVYLRESHQPSTESYSTHSVPVYHTANVQYSDGSAKNHGQQKPNLTVVSSDAITQKATFSNGQHDDVLAAPSIKGWLTKKAAGVGSSKRRFFRIIGDEIAYFSDEGTDTNGLNQLGSIPLTFRSQVDLKDSTLHIVNPDRTWVLIADSDALASRWYFHLRKHVTALEENEGFSKDAFITGTNHALIEEDDTRNLDDLDSENELIDMLPQQGVWLTKKAQSMGRARSRYFKLMFSKPRHSMVLRYYAALREGAPVDCKGHIIVDSPQDIKSSDQYIIITTFHREWRLVAKTTQEAQQWANNWIDAMNAHREGRKLMTHTGPSAQHQTLPLNVRLQQLLAQDSLNRNDIKETLRSEYGDGIMLKAEPLIEAAMERQEKVEQTQADMSGWLVKSAHKVGQKKMRFFELRGSTVRYYAEEQEGRGIKEKGFFILEEDADVVCESSSIEILTTDRVWSLQASSTEEATRWTFALQNARGKPVHIEMADVYDADDDISSEPEVSLPTLGSGWIVKSGQGRMAGDKRRFVVPVFGTVSRKLKLRYYAKKEEDLPPSDPKGYILLLDPQAISVDGPVIHIATDSRIWKLRAASDCIADDFADGWRQGVYFVNRYPSTDATKNTIDGNSINSAIDRWKLPLYVRGNELISQHRDVDDMMNILEKEYPQQQLSKEEEIVEQLISYAKLQQLREHSFTSAVSGWFLKKAQKRGKDRKRFFQLQGSNVHYFVDEKDGQGILPKGVIPIVPVTEIAADGKEILITNADRVWNLIAESNSQVLTWVDALLEARQRATSMVALKQHSRPSVVCRPANTTVPGNTPSTAVILREDAISPPVDVRNEINMTLGEGVWLNKQGEGMGRLTGDKRRYFVMAYNTSAAALYLCYYADFKEAPEDRKGQIILTPDADISVKGKVIILSLPDRRWKLTADSSKRAMVAVSQWRQILLDYRDFNMLPAQRISHELPLCVRAYQLVGLSMTSTVEIVLSTLREEYSEENVSEANAFIDRLVDFHRLFGQSSEPTVTGWFVKKAKRMGSSQRRFFELVDNTVSYFVDCEAGRGVDWKGSIPISPRTHLKQSLKNIIIANKDRTWDLMAESVDDAQQWITALRASKKDAEEEEKARQDLVRRMGFDESAAVPEDAEDASYAERAAWFREIDDVFNQSVKRYYVLFGWEQCELLVFEGVTDGQPFGRINTYKLSPDMAISVVERALTIVTPDWTLQLQAHNEYQSIDWAGVLRSVRRLMRAADADYRLKRELEAERIRALARLKEEEVRDMKKKEAAAIADQVFRLLRRPVEPDELEMVLKELPRRESIGNISRSEESDPTKQEHDNQSHTVSDPDILEERHNAIVASLSEEDSVVVSSEGEKSKTKRKRRRQRQPGCCCIC